MNTEGNNNKHGLSNTDNFYRVIGEIVQASVTVTTTFFLCILAVKLADYIFKAIIA